MRHLCQPIGELSLKGIQETTKAWALSDPDFNTDHYAKWVDYQLPGFNLQLNVQDIHNWRSAQYHQLSDSGARFNRKENRN